MPDQPLQGHPTPQQLDAYGRGAVDWRVAVLMETHVSACPDCQRSLDAPADEDALIGLLRRAVRRPSR